MFKSEQIGIFFFARKLRFELKKTSYRWRIWLKDAISQQASAMAVLASSKFAEIKFHRWSFLRPPFECLWQLCIGRNGLELADTETWWNQSIFRAVFYSRASSARWFSCSLRCFGLIRFVTISFFVKFLRISVDLQSCLHSVPLIAGLSLQFFQNGFKENGGSTEPQLLMWVLG